MKYTLNKFILNLKPVSLDLFRIVLEIWLLIGKEYAICLLFYQETEMNKFKENKTCLKIPHFGTKFDQKPFDLTPFEKSQVISITGLYTTRIERLPKVWENKNEAF